MDLDALAGVIAYKHTGEHVTTVTAAVDRITLKHPLHEVCDLELSGQVTFATGRSSMEVSIQVAKAPVEGKKVEESDILMTCAFTMVCFLNSSSDNNEVILMVCVKGFTRSRDQESHFYRTTEDDECGRGSTLQSRREEL